LQEFRLVLLQKHARQFPIHPTPSDQNEGETSNYALTVDVLGFQRATQALKPDDHVSPQGFYPTISRFLREGIQYSVDDLPETDVTTGPSVRLTSDHALQLPSFWKLMWVHVPVNNTIWVHVCFVPRISLEMLIYIGLLKEDHGATKASFDNHRKKVLGAQTTQRT
jgi:hypothetical protein